MELQVLKRSRNVVFPLLTLLAAAHGFYFLLQEGSERRELRRVVERSVEAGCSDIEALVRFTEVAFDIPSHRGVSIDYDLKHPLRRILRPTALEAYQKGGHCAKRSRLLVELLSIYGIEARKLYLYNREGLIRLKDPPRAWVHVVVEAKIDGMWVLADPLFNLVRIESSGRAVMAEDLASDREQLLEWMGAADERFDTWEAELYTFQEIRRFPWFALSAIGEPLRSLLCSAFGAATVDRWAPPGAAERPKIMIAVISFFCAAFFLVLTLTSGRSRFS